MTSKNKKLERLFEGFCDLPGFFRYKEYSGICYCLNRTKLNPKSVCVEIGAFKGKSTVAIAKYLYATDCDNFYSIDPHFGSVEVGEKSTWDEYYSNLKKFRILNKVKPIKDYSYNVIKTWDKRVDFLLIDGSHYYKDVKQDFLEWYPFVKNNCYIAFHDVVRMRYGFIPNLATMWEGPNRMFRKYVCLGNFNDIKFFYGLGIAKKVDSLSLKDKIINRLKYVYLLIVYITGGIWTVIADIIRPINPFRNKK